MKAGILDLSKCGGVCRVDCQHFKIGIPCDADQTYEPIKPRARFCWFCGRKLRGNHFEEMEYDGHKRIMHKSCANELKKTF